MPSSDRLICIDPRRVGATWLLARPFIKAAVDRAGLCDFAIVRQEILSGEQLLWVAGQPPTGAGSTQLIAVDGRKVCVIVTWSGEGWPSAALEQIEAYARAEGCSAIRLYGRPGWKRVLPDYGLKCVVLDREL